MIEVEFRSRFTKEDYDRVKKFLDIQAECLGDDDKDCIYYSYPDKLLKIVRNVSKGTAKISLKLGRLGEGAGFEEYEFHFEGKDFDLAHKIFNHLGLDAMELQESQKRINYFYKGCEIALKYGVTWGYHLEIEKMIDNSKLLVATEAEIRKVAEELGVKLMTEQEVKDFVEQIEKNYKK